MNAARIPRCRVCIGRLNYNLRPREFLLTIWRAQWLSRPLICWLTSLSPLPPSPLLERTETSRQNVSLQVAYTYSTACIVNIVVVVTCTRCNATVGRKIVRIDWMLGCVFAGNTLCVCARVCTRLNNLVEWFDYFVRRVEEKKRLDLREM